MSGDYRNLIAWQKAKRLALNVYRCTRRFPKDETYGLSSQMRRAATSQKEKDDIPTKTWFTSSIRLEGLSWSWKLKYRSHEISTTSISLRSKSWNRKQKR